METIQAEKAEAMETSTEEDALNKEMQIQVAPNQQSQKQIHDLACLLTRIDVFEKNFLDVVRLLNLQVADESWLTKMCGEATRPISTAINSTLNLWLGRNGSGATFQKLISVLKEVKMESTEKIVQDYFKATYPSEKEAIGKVTRKDITALTGLFADDASINREFMTFVRGLDLKPADNFELERKFEKEYNSGPFYNVVNKCLELWIARNGSQATWKFLVDTFKENDLQEVAEAVINHYQKHLSNTSGPNSSTGNL